MTPIKQLRSELLMLRARYDDGAVAPAMYAVIRKLETDIAWLENQQQAHHHKQGER